MKLKTLTTVVAVLAVLAIIAWLISSRDTEPVTEARVGQPVLEADLVSKIAEVHFTSSDKEITLANTSPDAGGAAWVIREYHNLPVDFGKLSRLITDLRDAKVQRFASSSPERMERMDFGDVVITLRNAAGEAIWTADLGANATSGGRFIKFGDEEKAFLANISTWFDSTAKSWADAKLLPVKTEDVLGLEISFDEGDPLELSRADANAEWTAEGLAENESIKASDVSSLLSRLTGLRFTETTELDAEDAVAARENSRTLKLETKQDKTYTISMGRRPAPPPPPPPPPPAEGEEAPPAPPAPKAGPVFVTIESSVSTDAINGLMDERAFQISEYTFTSLPKDRAALIETPPPPPEPGEDVGFSYDGPKSFEDEAAETAYIDATFSEFEEGRNGLRYKVLNKGEGETPKAGQTVQAHYAGRLLDGAQFDSSYDRGEPFSFVLGEGQVIKGWDDTLIDMKPGEKRLVVIPYRLGYGESGAGDDIPGKATLVFEIELVGIE